MVYLSMNRLEESNVVTGFDWVWVSFMNGVIGICWVWIPVEYENGSPKRSVLTGLD